MSSEKGQTLIELIIVIAVVVVVMGALTFATIASIRNAQFSKNQAQATKLAQEGIEKVRTARDRSDAIGGNFQNDGNLVDSWQDSDLWNFSIYQSCQPNTCYFKFNARAFSFLGRSNSIPASAEDPLEDGSKFKRVVILTDSPAVVSDGAGGTVPSYKVQKMVTVIVTWTDFSGSHESHLTTTLRKI